MIKTPFQGKKKNICYSRILSEPSGDLLRMCKAGEEKEFIFYYGTFMHLIAFMLTFSLPEIALIKSDFMLNNIK